MLKNFFKVKSATYNIMFSLYITLFCNILFFQEVHKISKSWLFSGSMFFIVTCLMILITNIIFIKKLVKPLSIFFIILNSGSLYFMMSYKIMIDKIMLLNVIQTDVYEVIDLLGWEIFVFFFITCIIPSVLILKTNIIFSSIKNELKQKTVISTILAMLCGIIIICDASAYKSFIRNHKYIKNYLIPANYVGAIISVTKIKLKYRKYTLTKISEDAELISTGHKPNLVVVIIGESARTASFSLLGYERETNEPLNDFKEELILFKNFSSCGTSTAVSLPCIFSPYERINFIPESSKYIENVLDIMNSAGYKVIWRENNTDCKDNCNRIEIEKFCQTKECFDDIMLRNFSEKVKSTDKPTVMVMHQRGSHGPMYVNRYPKEHEIYTPICNDENLSSCNVQSLINTYDNTIYYTSIVLRDTIKKLKSLSDEYNIALVFTSDHGESLGENGVYLHSAFYDTAPPEQTNVPTFFWFSEGYIEDNKIDTNCLKMLYEKELSHDNIFHTLISMSNIKSAYYKKELDILSPCKLPTM